MRPRPKIQRFEEVYPHYEFAPLVALALALGGWVKMASASISWRLRGRNAGDHATPDQA